MRSLELRTLLLWVILMVALGLRTWGINFGLIHADEPIIVNHAMAYGLGDLNPHFFKIPPLVSYLVFGLYGLEFLILKWIGHVKSAQDYALIFFSHPEPFYWAARALLGAFMGTATVAWVYAEARKLFSERAAVIAALFLAVNFLHVRESHFIYVDIPMVLAVCLAFSAARRVYETGAIKAYAAAGALIGLATAFKYNAALVSIAVFAAHVLRSKRVNLYLAMAAFVSLAAFAALNPFALLDANFFWTEIHSQAAAEGYIGFSHVIGYSLWHGAGAGLLILALIGAIFLIRQRLRLAFLFMSFPMVYFVSLLFFSQPHERYVLPLIPFLCLLAGLASDRLLASSLPAIVRRVFFAGILLALLIPSYKCIQISRLLEKPDTRRQMKEWIENNIPPGSVVAFDHSGFRPDLERTTSQLKAQLSRTDLPGAVRKKIILQAEYGKEPSYDLFFMSRSKTHDFSSVWPLVGWDKEELRRAGVQYIVFHEELNDPDTAFKESLKKGADSKAVFSPFRDEAQRNPSDPYAVTCAPYTGKDIRERKSLGPYLELVALKG